MEDSKYLTVFIIIKKELIDLGMNKDNPPNRKINAYGTSTRQFYYINSVLKSNNIQYEYITLNQFNELNHSKNNIYLFPGLNFSGGKRDKTGRSKSVDNAVKSGSSFILMSWQLFSVRQLVDVDIYRGNNRRWGFGPILSYRIVARDEGLLEGLSTNEFPIIGLEEDNFWLLPRRSGTAFKTLIEKIPQKENCGFISFGYQEIQNNQYVFLIDVINREFNEYHHKYLAKRLDNTIKFLINS